MEDATTIARKKAVARQQRYYQRKGEDIRARKRESYDATKAAQYYSDNRSTIRERQRTNYIALKTANQRTRLQQLLPIASLHFQTILQSLITAVDAGLMNDEEITGIEKAVLVENTNKKGEKMASDSKEDE